MSDVMTVASRRERVVEIDQRLAEIDTEFMGGALSADARSEWDELTEEREGHNEAIEDAERREKQLEQFAKDHTEDKVEFDDGEGEPKRSLGMEKAKSVRAVTTSGGKRIRDIYDLPAYRASTSSEDEYRSLLRDGAKRAVEQAVIPGYDVDETKAKETAMRLLQSVDDKKGTLARRILETGSELYQRAFGKALMAGGTGSLSPEEHRALAAGSGPDGGFAVPFTLDPTVILTTDGSINPLRQISRVIQITTSTWQGVTSGNVSVNRAAEAAASTDGSPTLAQPEVTPSRVHGFIPYSIEADQDWGALRSEMTMLLQEAKDDEEADSFVNGDGTGVNPHGVVATLDAAQEVAATSIASGGFVSEDVYTLSESLGPRFRSRARYMANISVFNDIRVFAASDGHDLWERIGADTPALLLGKPAHESSAMVGSGTATNRFLLYGDFTKFAIVDRVGMNVELVPHLFDASTGTPTGQRGIYAIWRNSSLVLVPNAFRVLTATA